MMALVEFAALIGLSIIGVPIAIAMGVMGLLFALIYSGFNSGTSLAGITSWYNSARFAVAMIPMFVLMGTICSVAGIGRDAYDTFYAWLGKIKGSLALVSVFTCAVFAALTGSSTATVAAIGGISVPEMKRLGYSRTLRLGTICASGTLGILIPPSIIMIFYGILTEVSIGKLFIAGIIPGIMTALLFALVIYVMVARNPSLAPPVEVHFTVTQKVASTARLLPIVLIFALVTFGIYGGWFSPEEAAAFGAFATLLVALAMRRLTWGKFVIAIKDSLKISGFVMLILMSAMLFAHTIALTGFSMKLRDFIGALNAPGWTIIAVMVIIYLGLGCVLDTFGMIVLTVPVFFPTVMAVGYDPIWFGVLVTVLTEIALITPPIGTNIYVTRSLEAEATSWEVIKGTMPFFFTELVVILLLVLFPQLALWLPSNMI